MNRESPWSKFWWSDWQNDMALKSCSYAARGLWMEMLAIMHASEDEGFLTISGRAVSARQLAGITNGTEKDVVRLIEELRANGVFSETAGGCIFSRRMIRDKHDRAQAREFGKRGGNPDLKRTKPKRDNPDGNGGDNGSGNGGHNGEDKGGVNPTLNLQEARGKKQEKEPPLASLGHPPPKASDRGSRLPDGWRPGAVDAEFATRLGLDAAFVAAKFRDYWSAKPGKDGRKSDWAATWRNWCRDDAERRVTVQPRLSAERPLQRSRSERLMDGLGLAEEHDAAFIQPQPELLN